MLSLFLKDDAPKSNHRSPSCPLRITVVANALAAAATFALLTGATPAQAAVGPYTIGNATPVSTFVVQGQSFTPSVQGNEGTGSPAAGPGNTVYLTSFTIDFNTAANAPLSVLYIYAFAPTATQASTGAGSLASGTHLGSGVYKFNNLPLTFSTKYYAVMPQAAQIFDSNAVNYTGGADLFNQSGTISEGPGGFDTGFNAAFSPTATAVPEPGTLALFPLGALALAGAAGIARRRRTSVVGSY